MQILSDTTVSGIADFLKGANVSKDLRLHNATGGSVQLFAPSGFTNFLAIGPAGSTLGYTGFYEGDIETCFSKIPVNSSKGFLRIGTADGEPVGVPRSIGSGTPIVYDTVSDSIYAYNNGWRQMAGGTKSIGYQTFVIPKWNGNGELVPSILADSGLHILWVNGDLFPGNHPKATGEHLGSASRKWDSVHAHAVYTDLTGVDLLGTDPDGKIVPSSVTPGGGGGGGNVSTSDGTKDRIPVWESTELLTNSPLAVSGVDVVPASTTVKLGTPAQPWAMVESVKLRAHSLKGVQWLSANVDGELVKNNSTPVTGSGAHGKLAKYSGPAGGSGSVIAPSLIEDDGASLTFGGSILSGMSTATVGTATNPWYRVYATNVYLVGTPNESVLKTGSDGRIQGGSLPTVDPATVYARPGGTSPRMAMFSSSNNIVDAPASVTSQDVVFNGRNLRQWSTGGQSLGTATYPWEHVYTKTGIRIANLTGGGSGVPYLRTNQWGDIVEQTAPPSSSVKPDWSKPSTDPAGILNKPTIPPAYSLPVATSTTLGGVKQGYGVTIGTDGRLSADVYSLPVASTTRLGGVKLGPSVTIDPSGVITAIGHQWSRRHVKWSNTAGALLNTNGSYQEWPALTSDYGYGIDFTSNTFTVKHGGLYTFSANGTVNNMGHGTSSGAMDDMRITFTVNGSTNYESIFVCNTGTTSFTNTFSVDRTFSLNQNDTVKIRYKFAVGSGDPNVFSLNVSATQVA